MIKSRLGDSLDATLLRLFPFLSRLRIHPNLFSIAGLGASLAGAGCFAVGEFRPGAVAVALGGFFDLTDGVLARQQGRSSHFGAFLDSTLDRVTDIALLFALAMYYAQAGQPHWAWLAGLALVSSVVISYSRARALLLLPDFEGGAFERAERIAVILFGAVLDLMPLALGVLALGATITAAQRIAQAWRRLNELETQNPSQGGNADGG